MRHAHPAFKPAGLSFLQAFAVGCEVQPRLAGPGDDDFLPPRPFEKRATGLERWFQPKRIGQMSPGGKVVVYGADLRLATAVAFALFVLLARSVGRYFKRSVGNADILFWMISQRILPPVVAVVPIYMMFQKVGMLDTHLAIILTYTVVNLPIAVWLMHDFFASIPMDLEESAQLDGASRLTVFFEIVPARADDRAPALRVPDG